MLHDGMRFRNEASADGNKLRRDIGNVTADTELTFEYQLRDRDALAKFKGLTSLPFQVQIQFTKLDGMRVILFFNFIASATDSFLIVMHSVCVCYPNPSQSHQHVL
jgi:hypothetical protein